MLSFGDTPCDVLKVAHLRQAIVYVRVALLLNFVQMRGLVNTESTTYLLIESLHDSRGQVLDLLRRGLPDGSLKDGALELGRLDKLIDDVERSKGEKLLLVPVLVSYSLVEKVLNRRTHEAFGVVGPMLLVHDQELNQRY